MIISVSCLATATSPFHTSICQGQLEFLPFPESSKQLFTQSLPITASTLSACRTNRMLNSPWDCKINKMDSHTALRKICKQQEALVLAISQPTILTEHYHWVSMLQSDSELTSADEFALYCFNDSELHFTIFSKTRHVILKAELVKVDSLSSHGHFSIHASCTCCTTSARILDQNFLYY